MGSATTTSSSNRFLSRDIYEGVLSNTAMSVDPYTGSRYAFGVHAGRRRVRRHVGHADSTARNGIFTTPGDQPDYTKGLFVTQTDTKEFQPVDAIDPKTREDCGDGAANWTYYMPLDSQGRAQGAIACLSKTGFNYTDKKGNLVKTGIPDTHIVGSPTVFPPGAPGWENSIPRGWATGLERGHLLARQLGGSGADRRNLVPPYPAANDPGMRREEDKVANAINAGNTVYYAVFANCSGNNTLPDSITITAYTASGTPILGMPVPNVP